jgi:ABC-type glycerol-3-phosphate transport system permease component
MRQYILDLPRDLEEAARIDGCGEFRIWLRVILPLCKPVLGAWGILSFTGVWKSFFWPFVVLGSEKLFTLEVGLQTLQQQYVSDYGLTMAGATVSAIPMIVVFFIFQKQIVRGLTFGAVKG